MRSSDAISDEYLKLIQHLYDATDKGAYFLCTCPECNKKEAYIYKKSPQFLNCNRQTNCGTSIRIPLEKKIDLSKVKDLSLIDETELTKNDIQYEHRTFLGEFIKYHAKNQKSEHIISNTLLERGLTEDVLRYARILEIDGGIKKLASVDSLKYSFHNKHRSDYYAKRDIIIPIYNEYDKLERLLLRSSDKTQQPKEIQFKLHHYASELWNAYELLNSQNKYVCITEGVIDGASIPVVDKSITPVGVTGIRKYRQLVNLIEKNIDQLKDKEFIIAFDNDLGGQKYAMKLQIDLLKLGLKARQLDLDKYKDVNELLQVDPVVLKSNLDKVKEELNMSTNQSISNEVLYDLMSKLSNQLEQGENTKKQKAEPIRISEHKFTISLKEVNKGLMRASGDVEVNGVKICGIKVVDGKNGLFVSMPRYQSTDGVYRDVVTLSKEIQDDLFPKILTEYSKLTNAKEVIEKTNLDDIQEENYEQDLE